VVESFILAVSKSENVGKVSGHSIFGSSSVESNGLVNFRSSGGMKAGGPEYASCPDESMKTLSAYAVHASKSRQRYSQVRYAYINILSFVARIAVMPHCLRMPDAPKTL
jgi:hypothetical protein